MPEKRMYFGTRERMTWIPCPAINAGLGGQRWLVSGGFLNGGGFQRQSTTGRKTFSFSWNPRPAEDIYEIMGYFDGLHGNGPYYFIDPFAAKSNVLPASVAAPGTMAGTAPTFGGSQRVSAVQTGPNTLGYPAISGQFAVGSNYGPYKTYSIPVPPGFSLHLGAHGTASGSASVVVGTPVAAPMRVNLAPNAALQSLTGVSVTPGTSGAANVTSLGAGYLGAGVRATWTTASSAQGTITLSGTNSRVPVPASTQLTSSVYVRPSTELSIRLVSGSAASQTAGVTVANGAYVTAPAGVWTRVSYTGTQSGAFREYRVQTSTGVPVGTTIDVDALLVETGGALNPYFDGSQAFARWDGAAFASSSSLLATNVTNLAMLPASSAQRTNLVLPGNTWYDVTVQGEGILTIAGIIGQILPDGVVPDAGGFIPGQGHTGVRLSGDPTVTGYSAAIENASVGMTVEFVETGAWEQ